MKWRRFGNGEYAINVNGNRSRDLASHYYPSRLQWDRHSVDSTTLAHQLPRTVTGISEFLTFQILNDSHTRLPPGYQEYQTGLMCWTYYWQTRVSFQLVSIGVTGRASDHNYSGAPEKSHFICGYVQSWGTPPHWLHTSVRNHPITSSQAVWPYCKSWRETGPS